MSYFTLVPPGYFVVSERFHMTTIVKTITTTTFFQGVTVLLYTQLCISIHLILHFNLNDPAF